MAFRVAGKLDKVVKNTVISKMFGLWKDELIHGTNS